MRIYHQSETQTRRTIIVVPCFNEAQRLQPRQFLDFAKQASGIRFLFVNDGSTDQTGMMLGELCSNSPEQFRRIDMPRNQGKAEAVRQGLLSALQETPDFVGYWDADLATPLGEVHRFVNVLDQKQAMDVVLGSRLSLLGRSVSRNFWRAVLGKCFAAVASLTLGFRVRDTQCGAKLFRVSDQLAMALVEPFSSRWIFDVELLARLMALHQQQTDSPCSLYENPLDNWEEVAGSKLRLRHFLRAGVELGSIGWRYSGARLQAYCERSSASAAGAALRTPVVAPVRNRAA